MAQFITYGLMAVWLVQVAGAAHHMVPVLLFSFGIGGVVGNQISPMVVGRLGPDGNGDRVPGHGCRRGGADVVIAAADLADPAR